MAQAQPAERVARHRRPGAEGVAAWGGPTQVAAMLGIAAVGFASYLLLVGQLAGGFDHPEAAMRIRHGAVISALIGFVLVMRLVMTAHLRGDVAALAPLVGEGDAAPQPEAAPELGARGTRLAALLGAAVGAAVVVASFGGLAPMREQWTAHSTWSLAANLLLFACMGQLAWSQQAGERFLHRTVTARIAVPLLDREALAPYARRGLRGCLFWFLGSSIASLLFANWGFSWSVFAVIVTTVGLGTAALVEPARRLRPRIREAKRAELARVRRAIESAREAALGPGEPAAAARLPGLLAWEARVEAVHEWPFDTATWLRFGVLALVAVGSWLGGAVVERMLGLALD